MSSVSGCQRRPSRSRTAVTGRASTTNVASDDRRQRRARQAERHAFVEEPASLQIRDRDDVPARLQRARGHPHANRVAFGGAEAAVERAVAAASRQDSRARWPCRSRRTRSPAAGCCACRACRSSARHRRLAARSRGPPRSGRCARGGRPTSRPARGARTASPSAAADWPTMKTASRAKSRQPAGPSANAALPPPGLPSSTSGASWARTDAARQQESAGHHDAGRRGRSLVSHVMLLARTPAALRIPCLQPAPCGRIV